MGEEPCPSDKVEEKTEKEKGLGYIVLTGYEDSYFSIVLGIPQLLSNLNTHVLTHYVLSFWIYRHTLAQCTHKCTHTNIPTQMLTD